MFRAHLSLRYYHFSWVTLSIRRDIDSDRDHPGGGPTYEGPTYSGPIYDGPIYDSSFYY